MQIKNNSNTKEKSKTKTKKSEVRDVRKNTCKKTSLIQRRVYQKNMDKSHRVCQKCWWDPKKGFALETSSHKVRMPKKCH